MSIFSKYLLMLFCLFTVLDAGNRPGSRPLFAQKQIPQEFRKIYVPEEFPDSWPTGNWQPFSSKKYFQFLEEKRKSSQQLWQAGMTRAHYQASFQNGRLVAGKLTGRLERSRQSASWKNLGATNLQLQSLNWKQGKTDWGTSSTGELHIHQQQNQTELEGTWSLNGTQGPQGTRFDLKLLRATQTTLQLKLPASVQLHLNERSKRLPCFMKEISPELNEWTLYLSSNSEITLFITPFTNSVNNHLLLSRPIHLLTLGVAEQKFVSSFQIEIPDQAEAKIKLFLPEGFEAERVEISQKKLSLWKTIESHDEFSSGVFIPIELHSDANQSPVTIRVSGELKQFKNRRLSTTFPRIFDAVQVESQITVIVESPLRTTNLETTDLYQIDARIGPGIRDTWSFTANGVNPTLDISVGIPVPELQIEQLVLCSRLPDQKHEVKYFMFWKTYDEGLFTARFRLFPGYDVKEVVVLSDANHEVPSSWSIRSEEDRKYLLIHLSNELVPSQKLAVSVSLHPQTGGNQQARISIPALQLVNGDLHEHQLLTFQEASLKQFPEQAPIATLPIVQLKKWISVWEELSVAFSETDNQWLFKDISAANRIIIKTNPHAENIIEQPPLPVAGEKTDKSSRSWKMKQAYPPEKSWNCVIKAIWHPRDSKLPQVQLEFNKQTEQAERFPRELKFTENVIVHSIMCNGRLFPFESTGKFFSIPETEKQLESLVITYSIHSRDALPIPSLPFPVDCDHFFFCLPRGSSPKLNEPVLFWQKLPGNYFAGLEVDPAFAQNLLLKPSFSTSSTPFDSLLSEYTSRYGYDLYEAHLNPEADTETIRLSVVPNSISWFLLFWGFLTILVLSVFLNLLFQRAHLSWILLSVLLCVLSVFVEERSWRMLLFPTVAALFIAAQLPGAFLKSFLNQRESDEEPLSKQGGTLRHLLSGSYNVLIISFWLYCPVLFAQPVQKNATAVQEQRADLLIPVKAELLTKKFQGLQPADYPDIVYLSEEVARQIKELESNSSELDEILFRSARYDVVWSERDAMQIRCHFDIIDARNQQADSLVLPLSGIDSFPALEATVNNKLVSINPLPDGSGLEIDLPQGKTSGRNGQRFREYSIDLNVIPQNKLLENGLQFSLKIPPVIQSRLKFQFPEKYEASLSTSPQQSIELLPFRDNGPVYHVGAIKQLNLIIDTSIKGDQQQQQKQYELFQASMLAEVSPRFLSLRLQIKVKFSENKDRTIQWKLPRRMAFRSVHALSHIEHRLESLTENETRLVLKIPDSKTDEETIVVDLILPIDAHSSTKEIILPNLLRKPDEAEFEQQWQIALQPAPGYELSEMKFPSISISRITASVFNQDWFGNNPVSPNAICFRLEKPGRMQIKLQKLEKELTVLAGHQLSVKNQQIHLSSRYQVDVIGMPLWSIAFENPTAWKLVSAQMKSEKASIPVRVMKKRGVIILAFAERIDDACVLQIHWKKQSRKTPTHLKITPPRIPDTLYYREILKTISQTPNSQWLVSTEQEKKKLSPGESVDSSPDWKDSLEIDADDLEEMPDVFLKHSTTNNMPKQQTEPSASTENENHKPETKPSSAANKPQQVKMDHTLWRYRDEWIGETLVLIPLAGLRNESKNLPQVEIHIPQQTKILRLLHHEALKIESVEGILSISPDPSALQQIPDEQFTLVMIQWFRPRLSSWEIVQSVPLPFSLQSNSTSWRLVDSRSNQRILSQTAKAWKTYLMQLSVLGREIESMPAMLPVSTSHLFQEILSQLPEQREKRVISALQKVPGQSFNQPFQLKLASVVEAGGSRSGLRELVTSSKDFAIRYGILFIALLWGWGMWRSSYAKCPPVRKRHLVFGSFLLLGLLATLMTNTY